MEILDIVDKNDQVIANTSYNTIYQKLLPHRIVHVLIFNNKNQLALQLRSKHKSFCPLHWSTTAGGHVQSGETYKRAALRELKEELGKLIKIEFIFKDFYKDSKYHIGLIKFLTTFKAVDNGPFKTNSKEVKKVQFFSLKQIQKMINRREKFHPELLFLLTKHFKINPRIG